MTASLDRITRGWRGPWLAALIALAAALPGLVWLPATDRSETRVAEASARMLEDGDFTAAAVDDQASDHRPLGVHWLQAASVAALSHPESRAIWAFRLPALLGVMTAAAACAWGGSALFGAGPGFVAGAILGSGVLVSSAGAIDTAGALLCAGVTLAVSALARIRLAADGGPRVGRKTRMLMWLGVALSATAGGVAGPAAVVLTGLMLWLIERKAQWMRGLGWTSGLIVLAAIVGPQLVAGAIDGVYGLPGFLPSNGAGERTPGLQLLLSPLLLFPFALMLPAGLMALKAVRRDPAARIALAWLLPSWLLLEFTRGPPLTGALAFYGALAWLFALAVRDGVGPVVAKAGVLLQALAAGALILALFYLTHRFGGGAALGWSVAASVLIAGSAFGGGFLLLRGRTLEALYVAGAFGIAAHGAALAGLAPHLDSLWIAPRAAAALKSAGLDPRDGVVPGAVAVSGFGEASLTFALGGVAETVEPDEAATALRMGRPVIVEARREDAFLAALPSPSVARRAGEVEGFDYANGSSVRLVIYGPAKPGAR